MKSGSRPANWRMGRTERRFPALPGSELAQLRAEAHNALDVHWQFAGENRRARDLARALVYQWLARQLRIPVDECHIGMFGKEECRRTIELCRTKGPGF